MPDKKEVNPLEVASDEIDKRLVESAKRTITQIANDVPDIETRMYEEEFVRNYLPLFYYDPNNVLNRLWLEISTSPMMEVILVDRDDKEVYRVPPFMPTALPSKEMQDLPIDQMAGDIKIDLDNNRGYAAQSTIDKVMDGLSSNTKLVNHDALWEAFYDRYNSMISITDKDGNDLLNVPKKKVADIDNHIDF